MCCKRGWVRATYWQPESKSVHRHWLSTLAAQESTSRQDRNHSMWADWSLWMKTRLPSKPDPISLGLKPQYDPAADLGLLETTCHFSQPVRAAP